MWSVIKRIRPPSLRRLHNLFPIIRWLPQYKWRENLWPDFLSGFIVGIASIPTGFNCFTKRKCKADMTFAFVGIAAGFLQALNAQFGLYTSMIPPLVYVLFGQSTHISVGMYLICARTVYTLTASSLLLACFFVTALLCVSRSNAIDTRHVSPDNHSSRYCTARRCPRQP
jgi:MFS superfamily sulfate permease-like transporter